MENKTKIIIGVGSLLVVILTIVYFYERKKKADAAAAAAAPANIRDILANVKLTALPAKQAIAFSPGSLQELVTPTATTTHSSLLSGIKINKSQLMQASNIATAAPLNLAVSAFGDATVGTDDVVNATGILLGNLNPDNYNYTNFCNRYQPLVQSTTSLPGAIYAGAAAGGLPMKANANNPTVAADAAALWLDLNKNFAPQINGMIGKMLDTAKKDVFDTRAANLYSGAKGAYDHTALAKQVVQLSNDCQDEIINEAIIQIDTQIYYPQGNYPDFIAANTNGWTALKITWEKTKWQDTNDANPSGVPMSYSTTHGESVGIIHTDAQNRLYLNDGLNITGSYNSSGLNLYKCTTYGDRGKSINNFVTQWQTAKDYTTRMSSGAGDLAAAIGFVTFALNCISGNYVGVAKYIISS